LVEVRNYVSSQKKFENLTYTKNFEIFGWTLI